MEDHLSKGERKRQERQSAVRKETFRNAAIWAIVIAATVGGSYWLIRQAKKSPGQKPGIAIPQLSRDHIPTGTKYSRYNSNPPTSGPHYPAPANWGAYDQPLPDEQLVHNLEHGGIWISYREPQDQQLVAQLKDIVKDYPTKVILTPRPEDDAKIAVAAWGRLLNLDQFDRQKIQDFIHAFIDQGPEQAP